MFKLFIIIIILTYYLFIIIIQEIIYHFLSSLYKNKITNQFPKIHWKLIVNSCFLLPTFETKISNLELNPKDIRKRLRLGSVCLWDGHGDWGLGESGLGVFKNRETFCGIFLGTDIGCCPLLLLLLVVGCRTLDIGHWTLDVGLWSSVVCPNRTETATR